MPLRILPPILANQMHVGGEVVERLSICKIEIQE